MAAGTYLKLTFTDAGGATQTATYAYVDKAKATTANVTAFANALITATQTNGILDNAGEALTTLTKAEYYETTYTPISLS